MRSDKKQITAKQRLIAEISEEIHQLADMESKLRRYIRRGVSPGERTIIDEQLEMIEYRIDRRRAELAALEGSKFAQQAMRMRDLKYQPVEPRPLIRITHFEEVNEPAYAAVGA